MEAEQIEASEPQQELSPSQEQQISEWLQDRVGVEPAPAAEEAPEPEPEPAVEPEPEPKKPRTSKAFAQIKERERKLREQQQELKRLEEEMKPLRSAAEKAKGGDQLGALQEIGWTYEKATEQVLKGGQYGAQKTQSDLEARLERLEKEKEELEKKNQQDQANRQVQEYVTTLKETVNSSEDYALTAARWEEAQEILLETQRQYAKQTGRLLSNEEVLGMIEGYFEETAMQLAQHDKIKKKLGYTKPESPQGTDSRGRRERKTRSLRNTGAAAPPQERPKPQTKRERLDAALAIYKQQQRS